MLLTKNRTLIIAIGLVLLIGIVLLFAAGQATADDADDEIGKGFDDGSTTFTTSGWDWGSSGQNIKVDIFLDNALAGLVFEIEVFVDPSTSTATTLPDPAKPAHVQRMSDFGSFPTGRLLSFTFASTKQITANTKVGIHLMGRDSNGNPIRVRTSSGPVNTNVLVPAPTPTPPPSVPTSTPVIAADVPIGQVTIVSAPVSGASAIIQPSTAASVSAPDGSVVLEIPATASANPFQLVYNPSPVIVPPPPARTTILRAFELNAHDVAGQQISPTLLRRITITAKYTAADLVVAQNNLANLKIMSYSEATQAWTPLNTIPDPVNQTLTAEISHLSLYGVASVQPALQVVGTPTPIPPPTGDFAPGSGLVLALILAGFILILAGGAYLTQNRRAKS